MFVVSKIFNWIQGSPRFKESFPSTYIFKEHVKIIKTYMAKFNEITLDRPMKN